MEININIEQLEVNNPQTKNNQQVKQLQEQINTLQESISALQEANYGELVATTLQDALDDSNWQDNDDTTLTIESRGVDIPNKNLTATEIAELVGITDENNNGKPEIVQAVARKLEFTPHEDPNRQHIEVRNYKTKRILVFYKPHATKAIVEWFDEHKDELRFAKYYQRNTKYGNIGDLRVFGYKFDRKEHVVWAARNSDKKDLPVNPEELRAN